MFSLKKVASSHSFIVACANNVKQTELLQSIRILSNISYAAINSFHHTTQPQNLSRYHRRTKSSKYRLRHPSFSCLYHSKPQEKLCHVDNFINITNQHRNYSSFSDFCSKLLTVKASETVDGATSTIPTPTNSADQATTSASSTFISDVKPSSFESTAPAPTLDANVSTSLPDVANVPASAAETTEFAANIPEVINVATDVAESAVAATSADPVDFTYIPVPPTPLPGGIDPSTLNALGEPSLSSLGLGGWGPVGLFQHALELLHVYTGLPWWGSIALITVMLRTALFPLIIVAQRNAAILNNVAPQMQAIQAKVTEARQSGDQLMAAKYSNELLMFMKERKVNPLKSMVVPLAQAPVFISVFVGLRRCAALPVVSMATGGMLWFTDLTVPDPYYLLPIITTITMSATIELGTEAGRMNVTSENTKLMFTVMRFMPLFCFPFMLKFSSAVLCYWVSTNACSLVQGLVLRVPEVRTYFNIPQIVKHNPDTLPLTKHQKKKSALQAAKDSYRNMKIVRELEDRQRYDEVRFSKAGVGPVVRTFKFDPTKVTDRKKNPPLTVKNK